LNVPESSANPALEKPALNMFKTRGENMCVSRMLATCERSVMLFPNNGSASGETLSPVSIV
jgi:hypothetical protein